MGILKNVTEGIEPIRSGGFKRGEMIMYLSKTRTGKSIFNDNLCKEIFFPGYPKTTSSLKRLMPKYQFSRANWYVAEYDWVHQAEVFEWCTKQFGPHPRRPDAWSRWQNKYSEKIHFAYEKDYQWFLLRWGV
jgi:hypothetical protein